MVKRGTRGLMVASVVLALYPLGAGAAAWRWLSAPLPLASTTVEVEIEPGTLPRAVAQAWVAGGVEVDARWLYAWFRVSGQASAIRAGNYELGSGMSARDLLRMMVRGDERLSTVRFVEGWTFEQVRAQLAQATGLKHTTASMSGDDIMAALDEPSRIRRRPFFPDTYSYGKGSDDLAVPPARPTAPCSSICKPPGRSASPTALCKHRNRR